MMRLTQLQRYLKVQKINLVFLTGLDPNIEYFTQVKPTQAILMVTPMKATFYISELDKKPKLKGITTRTLPKGWEEKFLNSRIRKVGVNKKTLTLASYEKIKKVWSKAKFVDISEKLNQLRQEKTAEEIRKIRKACRITGNALAALVKELPKKKLKTEQDVAFFLEEFIRSKGCKLAFPTIVATGKNSAIPHHITSTAKLKRGFLLIDFGARYGVYCADMTRMLFLGKPTKKEEEVYNLLLQAQQGAIKGIEEGIAFAGLDKMVRKRLGKYSSYFIHRLGHGVGIDIHEYPAFGDKKQVVKRGHVFTIEPGVYFPGKFGLRIEDTVLFDGKYRVLTEARRELVEIR